MDVEPKLRSIRKDIVRAPRQRGKARPLIVLGCQRSGTNALVSCFERDPAAKAYPEYCSLNRRSNKRSIRDSERYSLRLRPLPEVRRKLERLPYPLAVLKPLAESHRIGELLEELPGARIVWIFRHYIDVAESNARIFGDRVHRRNLEPIVEGRPRNWRSAGASDHVRETVTRLYRADMDPIDGGLLFWWARNQLLFDQGGDRNEALAAIQYRRFVEDPGTALGEIYELAGVPFPGPGICAQITSSYVGRGAELTPSSELERLCEELWLRLCSLDPAARARRGRGEPKRAAAES